MATKCRKVRRFLTSFAIVLGAALNAEMEHQTAHDSTVGGPQPMGERGAYLEPTINYRPHWTKPPMTYWAILAGMEILGKNEWGVRLGNAVAFCLTVALVVGLARW